MATLDDAHDEDCVCFRCKLRSIQISPSAMPSRRNKIAPRGGGNSWEKGVPTNSRGMPILDPKTGAPMGQARYAEMRSTVEEGRRKRHQTQATVKG